MDERPGSGSIERVAAAMDERPGSGSIERVAAAMDERPGSGSIERVAVAAVLAAAAVACGHGGDARAPRPACPATGPVVVYGPEDVAALAGCARVPGLTVRTAAPVELSSLTALVAIDGDLVLGPTLGISTVSLAALTEVTGTLRIAGNGDLTGVFLPALRRAGAVEIADDPALASLSAPALVEVAGRFALARLPSLELIDTHALVRVGGPVTVIAAPASITWLGRPEPPPAP